MPHEAAVAEVLGTLSVLVGMTRTCFGSDAEFPGGNRGDVGVEPLAHLGAAVVHLRCAVLIDQHQRAGLVQMGDA